MLNFTLMEGMLTYQMLCSFGVLLFRLIIMENIRLGDEKTAD